MLCYTVRRIVGVAPVLFFVTFLTFVLLRLTPGDPALILVGPRETSPETIAAIREKCRPGHDDVRPAYLKWIVENALQATSANIPI